MTIDKIGGNIIDSYTDNVVNSVAQSADDSFARRLEAAAQNSDDRELKKVCQEFEAIMLNMMYKQMKGTIIKSYLIEEDPGTAIFESMADEELMNQASKTGTLGLAQSLYKQLSRQHAKVASVAGWESANAALAAENEAAKAATAANTDADEINVAPIEEIQESERIDKESN